MILIMDISTRNALLAQEQNKQYHSTMLNGKKTIVSFVLVFLAAGIGSWVTIPSVGSWYQMLIKPSFSPPNALFGPVWTVLYIMMAFSFSIIWSSKKKTRNGIKFFLAQLLLNVLWSLVFFGLHNPVLAVVVIGLLWMGIFLTIREFQKTSKLAAWLLLPYILWVSFAAVLNLSIVLLN